MSARGGHGKAAKNAKVSNSHAARTPKTRILFVIHGHADLKPGGGELAAYHNYRTFQADDRYEAFLVAYLDGKRALSKDTALSRYELDRNAYFITMSDENYDFFYESYLTKSPSDSKRLLDSFRKLLATLAPDIVHFHHYQRLGVDLIGYVKKVLPDARVVLTFHDYTAICPHFGSMITRGPSSRLCHESSMHTCVQCFPRRTTIDFYLRKSFFLRNFQNVDLFISPSEFLKQRYHEWGLDAEQILVSDNGRPLWHIDSPAKRPQDSAFVVSFFGQILFHKGVDVFLRAACEYASMKKRQANNGEQELPPVRFAVHGKYGMLSPEFISNLESLLEEASEVVDYHGPYQPTQMKELLLRTDAVIIPSIWWENSPLVIQEAFMAKKPVVCSNIGGCAEHVQDRHNGLHFVVGDHFDLLNRILELAENPELYKRLVKGIPNVLDSQEMFTVLDREYQRILMEPVRRPKGSSISPVVIST